MNGLVVFGALLLLMDLLIYPKLQKEVVKPDCPNDVNAVKNNKKYFIIFLIVSIVMIISGIIMMLV